MLRGDFGHIKETVSMCGGESGGILAGSGRIKARDGGRAASHAVHLR